LSNIPINFQNICSNLIPQGILNLLIISKIKLFSDNILSGIFSILLFCSLRSWLICWKSSNWSTISFSLIGYYN
jgi:hypothetical protein